MKLKVFLDHIQLLPENDLDVQLIESWENHDFRAEDMAIIAGAAGVRRYFAGLILRLKR